MKPVFHNGRPRRDGERSALSKNAAKAPITDWSYQAASNARGGADSFGTKRASYRAFRALSNGFVEAEARRDRIETAVFAVGVALLAWPLGLAAQAAFQAFQLIP
ncbi:MAG TPA: hypothetical protein VG095_03130 [Chthoniobacterales bacterium]|nr:hypothetical protein [Chthoniobacterales bacterium]